MLSVMSAIRRPCKHNYPLGTTSGELLCSISKLYEYMFERYGEAKLNEISQ